MGSGSHRELGTSDRGQVEVETPLQSFRGVGQVAVDLESNCLKEVQGVLVPSRALEWLEQKTAVLAVAGAMRGS